MSITFRFQPTITKKNWETLVFALCCCNYFDVSSGPYISLVCSASRLSSCCYEVPSRERERALCACISKPLCMAVFTRLLYCQRGTFYSMLCSVLFNIKARKQFLISWDLFNCVSSVTKVMKWTCDCLNLLSGFCTHGELYYACNYLSRSLTCVFRCTTFAIYFFRFMYQRTNWSTDSVALQ